MSTNDGYTNGTNTNRDLFLCPVMTVIHIVQIRKEIVALSASTNDGCKNGTNPKRDLYLSVPSFDSFTQGTNT